MDMSVIMKSWIRLLQEASEKPRDIPYSLVDIVTSRSTDTRWQRQRLGCQPNNKSPVISTPTHLKGSEGKRKN
jgi:hypothetical protein